MKDAVAKEVEELRISFETALSGKRKYPVKEFPLSRKLFVVISR